MVAFLDLCRLYASSFGILYLVLSQNCAVGDGRFSPAQRLSFVCVVAWLSLPPSSPVSYRYRRVRAIEVCLLLLFACADKPLYVCVCSTACHVCVQFGNTEPRAATPFRGLQHAEPFSTADLSVA